MDCSRVVGFILRLKPQVFSLNLYNTTFRLEGVADEPFTEFYLYPDSGSEGTFYVGSGNDSRITIGPSDVDKLAYKYLVKLGLILNLHDPSMGILICELTEREKRKLDVVRPAEYTPAIRGEDEKRGDF